MALNWSSVKAEHVKEAFDLLKDGGLQSRQRGLVVWYGGVSLPAKQVLRVAYRLANGLPESANVTFSSGDGTLNVLHRLGFEASRIAPKASTE